MAQKKYHFNFHVCSVSFNEKDRTIKFYIEKTCREESRWLYPESYVYSWEDEDHRKDLNKFLCENLATKEKYKSIKDMCSALIGTNVAPNPKYKLGNENGVWWFTTDSLDW